MSRETASISLHEVFKIEMGSMRDRQGSRWQHIGIHQRIDGRDTVLEIAMFLPDGVSVLDIKMVDTINEGDD